MPLVDSRDELARLLADVDAWLPAVRVVCTRRRVATDRVEPLDGGSNLAAAAGADRVVKLYPPRWPDWWLRRTFR